MTLHRIACNRKNGKTKARERVIRGKLGTAAAAPCVKCSGSLLIFGLKLLFNTVCFFLKIGKAIAICR